MDIGSGATILVNVELSGIEQGKAALNAFGTVGAASAKRVEDAYKQVAASAMDFARAGANANQIAQLTGSSMKEAREAAALYAKTLATTGAEIRGVQLANQEMATAGFLAVQKAATTATPALNSMRASMTSLTASALQTAPGVAQVASVLGNLAIGAGPTVAVLAGIAALTAAWTAFGESARKAKEEQEKLTTSLLAWYDTQKQGAAGEFPKQIDAMIVKVKELRGELEKMNDGGIGSAVASVGAGGSRVSAWIRAAAGYLGSGNTVQLAVEMAKGADATVAAVKKGGAAIEAAREEVAKRLNQQTLDQLEGMRQLRESQYALWAQQIDPIVAGLKKLEVAYSGITAQLLAAGRAGDATSQLWREMQAAGGVKAKGGGIPSVGPSMPWESVFALPSKDEFKKYNDDIAHIWGDGINRMLTDGLKSYHDFFEDVLQLFSSLMKRMEQEGKAGGIGGRLLGLASAGISGGISGYQTGQTIGSAGLGALGGAGAGALTGAAIGSVIPVVGTAIGALVGGLAGLTGGLIGGSKAAHDRAVAEEELRRSLSQSIVAMRAQLGITDPLTASLLQNAEAFSQLRAQTEAAYAGRKNEAQRESILRELNDLEGKRAEALRKEAEAIRQTFNQDLDVRYAKATMSPQDAAAYQQTIAYQRELADAVKAYGSDSAEVAKLLAVQAAEAAQRQKELADAIAAAASAAAEAARKMNQTSQQNSLLRIYAATGQTELADALRNAIEIRDALADGLDSMSIELIKEAQVAEKAARDNERAAAAAQKAREVQAQAIQEQIRGAEQMLNTTRQAIDSVRKYLDSSKLGSLSPLGPQARYEEARRQYLALGSAAEGGDVKAFAQLPDAVEAFRRASQDMFSSGQRRADDFNASQIYLESLTSKFGVQATIQEQMLATLNAQLARLQAEALPKDIADKMTKPISDLVTAIGAPSGPRVDPTLPPGTGGPIGPPRRIPVRNLDDLFTMMDSHLYNMRQQNTSLGDYVARTNTVITTELPKQTGYQKDTRDYTKATSDGVARLRPELDIGGVVH